jgi:hypothetical protein
VRLRMRVSSSLLFAVVTKIKSSCACARWHIPHTAVCCRRQQHHTVRKEARAPAHEHEGLDTDEDVVAATVSSPLPLRVGRYKITK